MDERDFERIEALFTKLSEEFGRKLETQSEEFGKKVDGLSEEFGRKLDVQSKDFYSWIGAQGERFEDQLELIVEGHQMLSEKIDRLETRIDGIEHGLGRKIDRLAADLFEHVKDTEAHRGIYGVKEE